MANRPAPFRQADVTKALKGAAAAGLSVARVEIDRDGRIVLMTAVKETTDSAFDAWKAGRHARSA